MEGQNNNDILNLLPYAVVRFNPDLQVIYSNSAAVNLLKQKIGEKTVTLRDISWADQSGELLTPENHPVVRCFETGEHISGVTLSFFFPPETKKLRIETCAIPEFKEGFRTPCSVVFTFRESPDLRPAEIENSFRSLFELNPQPMWIYDLETLGFLEVNHAAVDHYGYSRKEFLGMTLKDIRPDEKVGLLLEDIQRTTADLNHAGVWHHIKKNGEVIDVKITSHSVIFNGRKARHVLANDVTAIQKTLNELEISEKRYRNLLENMAQGFCIIEKTDPATKQNIDFRYLEVNPAFERHTGMRNVVGKTILELLPNAEPSILNIYNNVVESGNHHHFESYVSSLKIWIEADVMPTEKPGQIAVWFNNVTERRQLEEALVRRKQLLKDMGKIARVGGWELNCKTMKQEWTDETYAIHDREPGVYDPNSTEELTRFEPGSKECIEKAFKSALMHGKPYDLELEMTTHKGNRKWVRAVCSPLMIEEKVVKLTGTLQDITERKLIDQKIAKLAERLNLATQSAGIGIWDWNIQKNELVWDEQMLSLYGLQTGNFNGAYEAWLNGVHPDDRDECNKISQSAVRGEREYDTEYRVLWPDGSEHWLKADGRVFRDETGTAIRMVGINYDITERKRSETNLRDSEQRFSTLFHTNPTPTGITHALDFRIVDVNKAWCKLTGYTPEEAIGHTSVELGLAKAQTLDNIRNIIKEQNSIQQTEIQLFSRNGEERHVLINSEWIDISGKKFMLNNLLDITERKIAEEKLRGSEARAQAMLSAVPDMLFRVDRNGTFLDYKADVQDLHTQSVSLIGLRNRDITPPEFADLIERKINDTLCTGQIQTFEYQLFIPGSGLQEFEARMAPSGPDEVISIVRNITERKHAEQKLLESEERLRMVLETTSDGFWIVDRMRRFIKVNESYCKMSGYSRQELLSMNISEIEANETPEVTNEHIQKIARIGSDRFETRHRRKDGTIFDVEVSVNLLDQSTGLMICFCRDITERKKAEKQLYESEAELNNAMGLAKMASWRFNLSASELTVSKNYRQLIGLEDETVEITFDYFVSRIHPDDVEYMNPEKYPLTPETPPIFFDFRMLMQDGSVRWLQNTLVGEFSEDRLIALKGTNIDITDKKIREEKIRSQNEKLHAILNSLPDKLFIHDSDGNFLEAYTTDPGGFIVPAEKILGSTLFDIFPKDVAELNLKYLKECLTSKKTITHEFSTDYKGSYSHFEVRVVPFMEDKVIRFVRDITQKKEIEKEILELNSSLERKVRERTAQLLEINEELVKAKETAEQANKAKSIFLANMSHEIRTPLNAIIGFSELLYNNLNNEKKRSQVESIRKSGLSLLNIINDILDLSKVEAGKIVIDNEPLNVFKIVSEVGRMFEPKAVEKKLDVIIELETSLSRPLLLDETRLRQILFNLIGNAVKFTNQGGVSVFIHHEEKDNDHVDLEIRIADTGIGIPEDQLRSIFEPFIQQQGQTQKSFGGTGLGLAISQRMAEAMGGEIRIKSKVNVGSEFILSLKNVVQSKSHSDEEVKSRPEYLTTHFAGKTILIVDDVADNRSLLLDVLEPTGARLLEAKDGVEAVRIATAELPDIILMDIRMPVMDGLEACKVLKQSPATAGIPCIAVSASIKLGHAGNEVPENFEESLMKPLAFDPLFEVLQKYLTPAVERGPALTSLSYEPVESDKEWSDDLKQYIVEKVSPVYQHVMRTQLVDEMEDFGKLLVYAGDRYHDKMLTATGKKIGEYADLFDVEKLTQMMHKFQFVLNRKLK